MRSYIYADGHEIRSGDELKLLGYYLGRRPRPDPHVTQMRRKFAARSWLLRILKHAGIPNQSLVEVYTSLVQPVLEYPSNVFHTMLTEESSKLLERLQRVALKSIYGLDKSYEFCLDQASILRLDQRRQELFESFTAKMAESPLFAPT